MDEHFDWEMVGKRVRELREERNIRLDDCGISRSHLSRLELGQRIFSLAIVEKLAARFALSIPHLLGILPDKLIEDDFVREVQPFLKRLTATQKAFILKTLAAAPVSVTTKRRISRESSNSTGGRASSSISLT